MKDKGKTINKNIKLKDNQEPKYKLKLGQEKEKIPLDKNEKKILTQKNNINGKKENGIGFIDTPNPDKDNKSKSDINDLINQMLSQKETKLLTDSQYISFDNFIGDNSCYVNVIMHFLYLFPCVNDFLIKKYQEHLKQIEKEKEIQKEKEKEKETQKEQESGKEKEKESQKDTPIDLKNEESEPQSKKEPVIQTPNEIITKKPENSIKSLDKKKKKENDLNNFLFNLGKINTNNDNMYEKEEDDDRFYFPNDIDGDFELFGVNFSKLSPKFKNIVGFSLIFLVFICIIMGLGWIQNIRGQNMNKKKKRKKTNDT